MTLLQEVLHPGCSWVQYHPFARAALIEDNIFLRKNFDKCNFYISNATSRNNFFFSSWQEMEGFFNDRVARSLKLREVFDLKLRITESPGLERTHKDH